MTKEQKLKEAESQLAVWDGKASWWDYRYDMLEKQAIEAAKAGDFETLHFNLFSIYIIGTCSGLHGGR